MTTETPTEALILEAVNLAERGYYVLPMLVEDSGRKRPLIKWGTEATTDVQTIHSEAWMEKWEDATHVGISCKPSGVVVVDIDAYYDEETERAVENEELLNEWRDLCDAQGEDPDNPVYADPHWTDTVRRGVHIYLRADPDRPIRSSIKDITHCIDVRAAGGQFGGLVVSYAELPPPADLHPVPEWLYELSQRSEREHDAPQAPPESPQYGDGEAGTDYGLKALTDELRLLHEQWDADEGHWNEDLNACAFAVGQLVGGGELNYGFAYDAVVEKLEELGAPTDQYKTLDSGFAAGYQRPRKRREIVVTPEAINAHASKWLSSAAIDQLPPPQWLIPGWLELNSLAQIFGDSNVGKSFIGLDVACRVSKGMNWPAHEGSAGRALKVGYVVAEGVAGMSDRRKAWESVHGPAGDILFYPEALQIMGPDWDIATEFLAEWGASLIVVDTQSRCTEGIDENKPEQMSKVVGRLDKMRRATGACVLLIHHTAKGGSTARGTNAIRASIETEAYVRTSYGRILVKNTKQKNAAPAPDIYFTLEPAGNSVVASLSIEVPHEMADAVQGSNAKMLIRQFLQEHIDVPQTTNDIIEATGLSRPYFHKKIKEMEEDSNEIIKSTVRRNSRNMSAYLWNPPVSGGE